MYTCALIQFIETFKLTVQYSTVQYSTIKTKMFDSEVDFDSRVDWNWSSLLQGYVSLKIWKGMRSRANFLLRGGCPLGFNKGVLSVHGGPFFAHVPKKHLKFVP